MLRLGSATAILVVLTAALPFAVLTVTGQRDADDNTLHVVLPRDAIPAISNPEFEPALAPNAAWRTTSSSLESWGIASGVRIPHGSSIATKSSMTRSKGDRSR